MRSRDNVAGSCLGVMFIAGLFLPTSMEGIVSKPLFYSGSALLLVLFSILFLLRGAPRRLPIIICALLINASLVFFTLMSPLTEFAVGSYAYYFLLSLLFCLNLREVRLPHWVLQLPALASLTLIACSAAIILQLPHIVSFFISHYSAFYPELVPSMLAAGKPVLTFGSHSLAGFFFYLFFLLNFKAFQTRASKASFAAAIVFLAVSVPLHSVTSYLFIAFAILQIVLHFGLHRRSAFRVGTAVVMLAGAVYASQSPTVEAAISAGLKEIVASRTNGLAARYTSQGTLAPNIDYILQNPLTPTGLRYSSDLWYVDSGPIEYVLRGSVILMLAIYVGLFLFLRDNLHSRASAHLLFGVYVAFEVGFSNLIYLRTLYLLPFIVIYCNALELRRVRNRVS